MWKNRLAFALLYAALLALLTAGQLGLHMTSGSRAITRRAVAWCLGISAVLCACAVGLSGTETVCLRKPYTAASRLSRSRSVRSICSCSGFLEKSWKMRLKLRYACLLAAK